MSLVENLQVSDAFEGVLCFCLVFFSQTDGDIGMWIFLLQNFVAHLVEHSLSPNSLSCITSSNLLMVCFLHALDILISLPISTYNI